MAFLARAIDVTIKLAQGAPNATSTFVGGTDQVTLSGRRVSAVITKAGGIFAGTADIKVYGLKLSMMNQLSTLGMIITGVPQNTITLTAGDQRNGMATVYVGTIVQAWADFGNVPEVPFHFETIAGAVESVRAVAPLSFRGSQDVATMLNGIANQINVKFENNGVQVRLPSPYYPGSPLEQAAAIVRDAGIEWSGLDNGKIAIWPRGGSRGGIIPRLSRDSGMIGSPSYTNYGIMLRTEYNRNIGFGGLIEVDSIIVNARNRWKVYGLDHHLESETNGGKWESTILAYNPAAPAPPPIAR